MQDLNHGVWDIRRDGINCTLTCPFCGDWVVISDIPGEAESFNNCPSCEAVLSVPVFQTHDIYNPHHMQFHCYCDCEHLEEREDEDGSCGYCKMVGGRFVGLMGNINHQLCNCVAANER